MKWLSPQHVQLLVASLSEQASKDHSSSSNNYLNLSHSASILRKRPRARDWSTMDVERFMAEGLEDLSEGEGKGRGQPVQAKRKRSKRER